MGLTREQRTERKAKQDRIAAAQAAVRQALAANACPDCGRPVRVNLSLTGWVQCSQYGSEGFRADSSLPSCNWQGFTE